MKKSQNNLFTEIFKSEFFFLSVTGWVGSGVGWEWGGLGVGVFMSLLSTFLKLENKGFVCLKLSKQVMNNPRLSSFWPK